MTINLPYRDIFPLRIALYTSEPKLYNHIYRVVLGGSFRAVSTDTKLTAAPSS